MVRNRSQKELLLCADLFHEEMVMEQRGRCDSTVFGLAGFNYERGRLWRKSTRSSPTGFALTFGGGSLLWSLTASALKVRFSIAKHCWMSRVVHKGPAARRLVLSGLLISEHGSDLRIMSCPTCSVVANLTCWISNRASWYHGQFHYYFQSFN